MRSRNTIRQCKSVSKKAAEKSAPEVSGLLRSLLILSVGLLVVAFPGQHVVAQDTAEITSSSEYLDISVAGESVPINGIFNTGKGSSAFFLSRPFDLTNSNIAQAIRVTQIGRNNIFRGNTINSINSQIAATQIGEENTAISSIVDSRDSTILQTQIGNRNLSHIGLLAGSDILINNVQIGENRNNKLMIVGRPGTRYFILNVGR